MSINNNNQSCSLSRTIDFGISPDWFVDYFVSLRGHNCIWDSTSHYLDEIWTATQAPADTSTAIHSPSDVVLPDIPTEQCCICPPCTYVCAHYLP